MKKKTLTTPQIAACWPRIKKLKQSDEWPVSRWFSDGDFETALNTIEQLQTALDTANEENERLRKAINTAIPMLVNHIRNGSSANPRGIAMLEQALKG